MPAYIVNRKLSDGGVRQHVYAWRGRGAPRISAPLGTPEFELEHNAACSARRKTTLAERSHFRKGPAKRMRDTASARAKRKGLEFALTVNDLMEIFEDQAAACAVTGVRFDMKGSRRADFKANPYGPSLDRVKSSGGYVRTNVRLVLVAVNSAMNEWGTEIFLDIAKKAVAFARA